MECNKEEAIRAKAIAERKLTEKDFSGAKKFVLKAQNLFPGLEGITQISTTLDVFIASENKVNGEVDWYGILGVNPSADDENIRKQYRKLALVLHPDKNKSIGADGAFKLLSEAWSLLSDKTKRLAYNHRRFSKGILHNVLTKSGGPTAPPNANGFHNFSNRATSNAKIAKNNTRVHLTSVPRSLHRTDTFWTICHRCKMHYEYLRAYLNHTLLCPNCHQAFLASETAPPVNFSKPSSSSSQQRSQNASHHAPNGNPVNPGRGPAPSIYTNAPQGPCSRTTGTGNTATVETLKREHEEAQAGGGWGSLLKKRRGQYDNGTGGIGMGVYGSSGFSNNNNRDFTQIDIRSLLIGRARAEICKKLNEWHLEDVAKAADSMRGKVKEKEKEKEKSSLKGHTFAVNRNGGSFATTAAADVDKEVIGPVVMNVPDPDFYDFDQDRTESSFREDQIWASYDDDDGMPRFYAMIHKVISLNPFKMEISWLNSKTNSEFAPLDWIVSGFRKTCGDFRGGKHEINKSLNAFSHKVKWAKGPRGNVCIYPKRGDVWALYRNWSADWNEHTPDETIHKYDMMEVLEDYDESQGVYIAPLIKVSGFKTVFQTNSDPEKVRRIPKEEMFRFSHQVPHHMLTGLEGQNAPKGCLELDPAATPLELLQVIKEDSKTGTEENAGKAQKQILKDSSGIRVDAIVMDVAETKDEHMVEISEERKKGETILKYSRKH